jgi:Antitoxin VbhA
MSDASHFLLKSATQAPRISADERQRRQEVVDFARASMALEGFERSAQAEALARRFVEGEIDLKEYMFPNFEDVHAR